MRLDRSGHSPWRQSGLLPCPGRASLARARSGAHDPRAIPTLEGHARFFPIRAALDEIEEHELALLIGHNPIATEVPAHVDGFHWIGAVAETAAAAIELKAAVLLRKNGAWVRAPGFDIVLDPDAAAARRRAWASLRRARQIQHAWHTRSPHHRHARCSFTSGAANDEPGCVSVGRSHPARA
jgi:hypothetical protein